MRSTQPPHDPEPSGGGPAPGDLERLQAAHDAAVQALQAIVRDTGRLARLFTVLSEPAPLPSLLDRTLSTLSELFSSDVVLLLVPDGTGAFTPLASIGLPEHLHPVTLAGGEDGRLAAALRTLVPVVADGEDGEPPLEPLLRDLGVRTAAWIPAVGDDGVAAALLLGRCRPSPFARVELDLLTAMAYRVALVLEHRRAEEALRETQERLIQAERMALAGPLAATISHEVNNPLAVVLVSLGASRRLLPAVSAAFRAAYLSERLLAGERGQPSPEEAQLRASLEELRGAQGLPGELAELLGEGLEGARRIVQLVESLRRLTGTEPIGELEPQDLWATIAGAVAELPPGSGARVVRREADAGPCVAWHSPPVVQAALAELLRYLGSSELRRSSTPPALVVRAALHQGRPAVIVSDPTIHLSAEVRRSLFDPRLEEVDSPSGRTMHLSLKAAVGYQLLRRCGADITTASDPALGLTILIVLPPPPATAPACA